MKAIWKYVWMKERWGQSRSTRLANSWDVWASFNKELPLAFIKHVKRAQAVPSSEDIWLSALFSSISLITTWFQAITFWMEIQISVKNPSPLFCCAPASLPTWTSILQQIEGSLILKDSQLLCQPHSIRDAWFGISQTAELCVLAWTESLDVLKLVLPEHCWTPASQHSQASSCLLSGKKLMDIPSTTWGWGCINSPTRWLHRREEAQHLPAQHPYHMPAAQDKQGRLLLALDWSKPGNPASQNWVLDPVRHKAASPEGFWATNCGLQGMIHIKCINTSMKRKCNCSPSLITPSFLPQVH